MQFSEVMPAKDVPTPVECLQTLCVVKNELTKCLQMIKSLIRDTL